MNEEKPPIKKENGETSIDVIVNLDQGLCARPSTSFVIECQSFLEDDRKAVLVNRSGEEYNCKSLWDVICSCAFFQSEFTIKVQGQDEKAEQYALRIYSALTSGNSFYLDFYRFERNDDGQIK